MKTPAQAGIFGKYREIVLAVAFFLVFDLAVLVLNFYTSFQISADAVSINLSGRQRMLSQRMTKSLLMLEADRRAQTDAGEALRELKGAVELFSATLEGFRSGGAVTGGGNLPVQLQAISGNTGRNIVADAYAIWAPYRVALAPILEGNASDEQLTTAVNYARGANGKLLSLMNSLTTELEKEASAKADRLRAVQTAGIALALLNFGFILFKFIRRLRESDRQTEIAQKETGEILATVKDGLFLLDREGRIGVLHSASLDAILRRPVTAGQDFMALLAGMVDKDGFDTAKDYIELLFGERVRENLVLSLNPLQEVKVLTRKEDGTPEEHYLAFHFNRVVQDGQVAHLLVTASDITEKVVLAAKLETAKAEKRQEVDILLKLFNAHPDVMRRFLDETEGALHGINACLRQGAENEEGLRPVLNQAFRVMHTIKGNAAAVELDVFEHLAHDFETTLVELGKQSAPDGEAVLRLAVRLDEFFQRLAVVKSIFKRLAEHYGQSAEARADEAAELVRRIDALARRIALDQDKHVEVEGDLPAFARLPAKVKSSLSEIAVQLARNAVVHGIEAPAERLASNKQDVGHIQLHCAEHPEQGFEFVLRDDGRGLSPERIRAALLRDGHYTEAQLAELTDKQVIMKLFEPGFSTLEQASQDAGRGFGLDVVQASIQKLGGRLLINSRPHGFTEFRIRFAA